MKKNEEIKKELDELSPFLAGLKKENAFKVPKNYFDNLPDEILEQVQPRPATQVSRQTSWLDQLVESIAFLLQPRYAAGLATVAILLVAGIFYLQKPANQIANGGFDSSIAQYISDNIDEFDADMLYELSVSDLNQKDIFDETTTDPIDEYIDEIIDGLDDSDLEEFL